uniref:CSON011012 protein n=1 Tax=Culicoides sonorensis TaxID=179676 RepID=A0A336MZZ0_CULSO
RRMDGKTVIITGANGGIGKETAKFLAKLGARVIMACRNLDAANSVRDEIIKETQNPNVIVKKLDLSSFRSVREFASEINRSEERLDVLLHNAGYANTFKKEVSEDGIEMTMATNHYGPFLLTHLLIDLLKKTDNSRIVVVASYLYKLARLNLNKLNPIGTLPGYLYYVSKNANIMFTRELSKRLEGTGVTANSLHPGLVDTGIWRVNDWYIPFFRDDQVHVYGKIFSIIVFFFVTRYLSAIKVRYFYPKMKSVREFASEINRSEQRLDVLIHNAGYANTFTKLLSRDGIEMTMATNHYGPFLLTHLLIDLLKKTENSRIVVVSSYLYKLARLNLNKLNPIGTLPAYLYYVSKNANIMFTRELAKRLQGTGVTANCVHPGLVDSGIWRNVPFPLNIPLKFIIFCFFKTPWQGCQTTVFCAVSEQLEGVSGKYYEYNRETKLEDYVTDEEKNAKFWEASAKL